MSGAALFFSTTPLPRQYVPLTAWQRLLGRGPWSGAGFVLLIALATYTCAILIVTLVPDRIHFFQRGTRRAPLELLLWGTVWSLAFLLALSQAGVWLSRRLSSKAARGLLVSLLLCATSLPALAWALAPPREGGSLWQGTFLSPVTALASISEAPHLADRRLLLFGLSEADLLASHAGESQLQRARLRAEQAGRGLEVHRLSAALYFALGLAFLVLNAGGGQTEAESEGEQPAGGPATPAPSAPALPPESAPGAGGDRGEAAGAQGESAPLGEPDASPAQPEPPDSELPPSAGPEAPPQPEPPEEGRDGEEGAQDEEGEGWITPSAS